MARIGHNCLSIKKASGFKEILKTYELKHIPAKLFPDGLSGERTHAMRADEPLHFGIGNPHREEHGTDPATLSIESLEILRVEAA